MRPFEHFRPSTLLQEFVDLRYDMLTADWSRPEDLVRLVDLAREIDVRFGAIGEDE